jgi:hypothetical protein
MDHGPHMGRRPKRGTFTTPSLWRIRCSRPSVLGPCTIVHPVDRDVAGLSGGILATNRVDLALGADYKAAPTRILQRVPHSSPPGHSTPVGLALLTETSHVPSVLETNVATVSLEQLSREQKNDEECKRVLKTAPRTGLYDLNQDGILIRIAPSDGTHHTVVPSSLVARILYLEHYPPASGYPGADRMSKTIRRSFFWPKMVEDVYETVRQCDVCARNRISERTHANMLKLFPAKGPL